MMLYVCDVMYIMSVSCILVSRIQHYSRIYNITHKLNVFLVVDGSSAGVV
jgi:hypothetical protein